MKMKLKPRQADALGKVLLPHETLLLTRDASLNMHFIINSIAGSIRPTSDLLLSAKHPCAVSFADDIRVNTSLMSLTHVIKDPAMTVSNKSCQQINWN